MRRQRFPSIDGFDIGLHALVYADIGSILTPLHFYLFLLPRLLVPGRAKGCKACNLLYSFRLYLTLVIQLSS